MISQYYSPDITAAAHRITDLRYFLESRGHKVDVITSFPHKVTLEFVQESEAGITRVRLPIGAASTAARLWEQTLFATKALGAYLLRHRKEQYDFVLASSPPLFVGVAGYLAAKWSGARFILDIRDIWPGSVAAAGVASGTSLPIRVASRLERWLYRVADYLTCVSQPMKEYLEQFTDSDKIRVVYNGVNTSSVPGKRQQASQRSNYIDGLPTKVRDNHPSGSTICVAYAGNIGLVQDVHVLIDALQYVQPETLERLQVCIIGTGPERIRLERLVSENPIAARLVAFDGPYPKEELSEILSTSVDALFIHLRSDPVLDRTIPSKVFDSCLYNLPIIYGLSGEGHDILSRLPGTLPFRQGAPESLAAALDQLVASYPAYLEAAQGHRTFVETHFSREVCFRPLLDFVV